MSRVRQLALTAADQLISKKRWGAAAAILEKFLVSHPDNQQDAEVLRRLGKVRLAQGEPKAAAELFERALSRYREAMLAEHVDDPLA